MANLANKNSTSFYLNKESIFSDMSFLTNAIALLVLLLSFVSPWFSLYLKNIGLFALSGALTNWLAIHMLFEKVPGLYGSGVIALRFQEFKDGIRSLVMNEFFTLDNIKRFSKINQSDTLLNELKKIGEKVNFEKVYENLLSSILSSPLGGMLSMVGGASALEPAKPNIIKQIQTSFKNILEEDDVNLFIKAKLQESTDPKKLSDKVEQIVFQRLEELTPNMVKSIIQNMIKKHLGWLVLWGGVFGGLIGLVAAFF